MKNLSKIVSIVAIVTSVVSTSAEAAMSIARLNSDQVLLTKATINKSEFGVTNTGNQNLNVRKSASTNSELLGKLPTGSKVEIVDKLANGWYKIKYKSSYGYVDSRYVIISVAVNEFGITNTGNQNLNVRKSASTNSELLGKLPTGSKVEIVDKLANGWYRIKYKSSYGYVDSKYIDSKIPISVTGVKLNKATLSLEKGKSETLKATISPSNASNKGVTWTSSNSKVATVDKNGKVKAIAPGTATITVKTKDKGKTAKCTVKVKSVSVTGVKLNKATLSLEKGKSETLKATISPSNASNKGVTWTSSNSKVATVDKNGKVKAIAPGTATITVKTKDKGKTAKCTVKVKSVSVTGVKLNKATLSLEKGKSETLKATISPSNASNKGVTWTSSNSKVATVDKNGKVKAIAPGTATITVKTKDKGKTAKCTVKVKSVSVTGVKLNKATLSLEKGKSETLKATISPSNASNKGVTWTSSNSKVATVDKNGKVKAISKGTATIIVKTKDKGKTAKCTVTVNDISKARQKILDNARKMVYFEWSPKYQFSAWRAQKTFKPGTKYKGIPYTQNVQVKNTSEFISKINSRKDLTVVIGGITMPRYGNDCSGFISAVWQIPRQTTPNLKNGNYTTKLNNFNELQPGDAIVTITPWEKRHVRLFVRWADSSKTKMVVYEQTPPQAKESTYSVSDLKVKGYTPIRLKDEYLNKIK